MGRAEKTAVRGLQGYGNDPAKTGSIYALFIFVLVFAPLAFGTVEEWSVAVMETASLAAFTLYLYAGHGKRSFYDMPGIIPLLILLAYACFQCVPLPAGAIRLISPGAASLYETTAIAGGSADWRPISVNTKATVMEFFRLASYVSFYALTVQLLARKESLKRTVATIAVFASMLSFFAILQHVLSNNRIFWIRQVTQGRAPFGPYVNPDHYAGLMEMMFPLVLGLFLFYKPAVSYETLRERISGILDHKAANVHILLGLSTVLTATSIFLTLSRGGIVSLCISMAFLGVLLMAKERKKGRGRLIAIVFIVILLSVGWFGWSPLLEKFGKTAAENKISDRRIGIWKDSLGLIKDFPLTGAGFGNFVFVYPKYRSLSAPVLVDHAHNDYIELLAEGGIAAIVLFAWFFAEVLLKSWKVFKRRRDHYSICISAGAAAGLVSILLHSFVDFNLHIGANGLYFFFLAALAVSAANTRMREGAGETSLSKRELPRAGRRLSAVWLLILFTGIIFNAGILLGKTSFSGAEELSRSPQPSKEEITKIKDLSLRAAFFDPLEAGYYNSAAGAEWRLGDRERALRDYKTAVRLDPASGEYTQMLGLLVADSGKDDAADALLRAGTRLDGSNPEVYKRYASWLFARGRKEDGAAIVRKAISLEPRDTKDYITLMVLYGLDDGQVRSAVPDLAEPRLLLADYLSGTGNDAMADEEYKNALVHAKREKAADRSFFEKIYRYYDRRDMRDDAVMVMSIAVEILPEDEGIRLAAGDAYEKAGITYRAAEEYRKALVIDPGSKTARKKLDGLRQ